MENPPPVPPPIPLMPPPIPSMAPPVPRMALPIGAYPLPAPPQRRIWPWVTGIVVLVLALIGGGIGVAVRVAARNALPPMLLESDKGRRQEIYSAYHGGLTSEPDATDMAAIHGLFDRLGAARAAPSPTAFSACFDFDHMVAEFRRQDNSGTITSTNVSQMQNGLRTGMLNTMVREAPMSRWNSYDLNYVRFLDNTHREALAYTTEHRVSGIRLRIRWWLHKVSGRWLIYDFESLAENRRATRDMARSIQSAMYGGNSISGAMPYIESASQDLMQNQLDKAEKSLTAIEHTQLPPPLDGTRRVLMASLRIRQGRTVDGLKELDRADAVSPGIPVVDLLRATAYNRMGKYQQALELSTQYVQEVGGDGEGFGQQGDALAALKRTADAATAYRNGIQEDPDEEENYAGLARVLPKGSKAELTGLLAAVKQPARLFRALAQDAVRRRDGEALDAWIKGYSLRGEEDFWLAYYTGELEFLNGHPAAAAKIFHDNWDRTSGPSRQSFLNEYTASMLAAGDPMTAYRERPDPEPAFRSVARSLLAKKDTAHLRQLIALHRSAHGNDPWTDYYEASLAEQSGDKTAASSLYRKAWSRATQTADRETFRRQAVRAGYDAGQALEVLSQVGARAATFDQLVRLYSRDKDGKGLAALIAAQKAQVSDDPQIPLWDAEAHYLDGDYPGAISILTANRPTIESQASSTWQMRDRLVRSYVRTKQFIPALREATKGNDNLTDPALKAIVYASVNDTAKAIAALDRELEEEDGDVEALYADPDLGPLFRTPALADWRNMHPQPGKPK